MPEVIQWIAWSLKGEDFLCKKLFNGTLQGTVT